MQLNYKKYGETGAHLIILHGLFGMLDNWHTLAARFGANFQVWALDQRNHGKSPHSPVFDYESMAADLLEFYDNHQISQANVMGHSMGGKTAMQFALTYPDKVSKLIVADISPRAYPETGHHMEMEALQSLDLGSITRRADADEALAKQIPLESTRQFLLKNLSREGERFVLKLNLEAISKNYDKISVKIDAGNHLFDKETLFICGAESDYIIENDKPGILKLFPKARFVSIPGAGHWVHAESPEKFYEAAEGFLAAN
jgi:esterase